MFTDQLIAKPMTFDSLAWVGSQWRSQKGVGGGGGL